MFTPASRWFCCLTFADKVAVVGTATLFTVSLMTPIEATTFDLLWTPTQMYIAGLRATVLSIYGLEDTFIYIPDEPPIPAIGIVDALLWLDIEGFLLTGGADCPDGCDVPTWAVP